MIMVQTYRKHQPILNLYASTHFYFIQLQFSGDRLKESLVVTQLQIYCIRNVEQ